MPYNSFIAAHQPETIMAKFTEDQIAKTSELSTFYVTEEGTWLRILYTSFEEGYFLAMDEDTGEEFDFLFSDVAKLEDPEFHHLVRLPVVK